MFILLLIPTCQANILHRHTGSRFTVAFGGGFHELGLVKLLERVAFQLIYFRE